MKIFAKVFVFNTTYHQKEVDRYKLHPSPTRLGIKQWPHNNPLVLLYSLKWTRNCHDFWVEVDHALSVSQWPSSPACHIIISAALLLKVDEELKCCHVFLVEVDHALSVFQWPSSPACHLIISDLCEGYRSNGTVWRRDCMSKILEKNGVTQNHVGTLWLWGWTIQTGHPPT